jgi:predicted enzyme related to lactoylglutathione lyase
MHFVRDLDAAAAFYERELGVGRAWTDRARGMAGFHLAERNGEIVLHTDPTLPNPDVCFQVDDVVQFLAGYAGRVLKGPFDVRCGKMAVLADPDGNKVSILDLTAFGGVPRYDEPVEEVGR